MISSVTEVIGKAMLQVFRLPELVTLFISILPIVEARGAIPMAIGYGIHPLLALTYAFIGSSVMAPILIAVLLPFVKWLSKTKLFRRVGETLADKFESKSNEILSKEDETQSKAKRDFKKMLGVFAFVAIPVPLTGVWTGSAVAAATKLPYHKALIAVITGNLVASSIITLLCYFFAEQIDYIILAIAIIAAIAVIALIIKIIIHKPKKTENAEDDNNISEEK